MPHQYVVFKPAGGVQIILNVARLVVADRLQVTQSVFVPLSRQIDVEVAISISKREARRQDMVRFANGVGGVEDGR